MNSTYHFQVPETKINYSVKLTYEEGLLREFQITNIIWNSRSVTMGDIPLNERELFIKHVSDKVKNISIQK